MLQAWQQLLFDHFVGIVDVNSSLEDLLKANDVPAEVFPFLKGRPYQMASVKQLANFFDNRSEVASLFLNNTKFKEQDAIITNLKQAWREAESIVTRSLKRASQGLPEDSSGSPSDARRSLQ